MKVQEEVLPQIKIDLMIPGPGKISPQKLV